MKWTRIGLLRPELAKRAWGLVLVMALVAPSGAAVQAPAMCCPTP